MLRIRFLLPVLLLFSLVLTLDAQQFDLNRIQQATVLVIQTRISGEQTIVTCVGSGTVVNRTGLIATNAHNTVANNDCPGDRIIIAVNVSADAPPVPTYYAEVSQANIGLDLAMLRISAEVNGRRIEPGTLNLPFVELGDSSAVLLDDTINVFGYAGLGDEPVLSSRGTISGFIAEPSAGDRAWMKTDARIPGTMTGGGVYNQAGRLIGVPTTVPIISLSPDQVNCIPLIDTNNDGLVNANDSCVPVGGFINAIRPSSFVRPLLRAASLGLTVEKVSTPTIQLTAPTDAPIFSRLLISPSQADGMPTTVAKSLPIGVNRLYLFFDYRNMQPQDIYELRTTIDGAPSQRFSLAPVRWSGGVNGLWYIGIGSDAETLPNGAYEFTLLINGLFADSRTIIVGDSAQGEATFRNIFFCIESGGNCYGDVYVLPVGNTVSARFIHQNVPVGTAWTARWFFNDVEIPGSRTDSEWEQENLDVKVTALSSPSGLPPGRYRLELYLVGELAATADFTIAGASEGAFSRVFSNARFATGSTLDAVVTSPGVSSFTASSQDIYAVFNWEQLAPGTLWTMRWLVDNVVFFEETVPWTGLESGQNFIARLVGTNGIPDGAYRMELAINSVTFDNTVINAEVGIGQLTIDVLAQTSGVQLGGKIVDSETGEGLAGVSFILISEDYSIEDFEWQQDQVFAIAITDRNGDFQVDRLLEFDAPYSLIIIAEGYLPLTQDGILVDNETANPLYVEYPLIKD